MAETKAERTHREKLLKQGVGVFRGTALAHVSFEL